MKTILLVFASVVAATFAANSGRLLCVQFCHCYGDRAPISTYPTDTYKDEQKYWPNGWGQLTEKGKKRMYDFGSWIRKKYGGFISDYYYYKDIYVESTFLDRAIMSAEMTLTGLFPKGKWWSSQVNWQPVPVHVKEQNDEELMMTKPCPKYDELYCELMTNLNPIAENLLPTVERIQEYSGVTTFLETVMVLDALEVQQENGLKLPIETKTFFPKPGNEVTYFYFQTACMTRPLQRLKCGPLLKRLLINFDLCSQKKTTIKFWQFSAHDTTVMNLAQCLGLVLKRKPSYAAAIFLELKERNGNFYVTLYYKVDTKRRVIKVPGCERNCTLKKLKHVLRFVIPKNWKNECHL